MKNAFKFGFGFSAGSYCFSSLISFLGLILILALISPVFPVIGGILAGIWSVVSMIFGILIFLAKAAFWIALIGGCGWLIVQLFKMMSGSPK